MSIKYGEPLLFKHQNVCKQSGRIKVLSITNKVKDVSKASKIWNKLSRSLSVIYVKHPVCLCLNPPSICMHIHVDKYILNVRKVVNS